MLQGGGRARGDREKKRKRERESERVRKGEREIKERERESGGALSFSLFSPSHTTLSSPSFSSPRTILSIPPTLNHPFSVTLAALFSPFCSTFFPLRRATLPPLSHSLILLPLSISFSLVVRPHLVPLLFFPAGSPFCLSREFQSLLFSSLLSLLHARLLLCLLRNRFFLARSFPSPFRSSLSIVISPLPLLSRLPPLPLFSSM